MNPGADRTVVLSGFAQLPPRRRSLSGDSPIDRSLPPRVLTGRDGLAVVDRRTRPGGTTEERANPALVQVVVRVAVLHAWGIDDGRSFPERQAARGVALPSGQESRYNVSG
jgi:hypothetical protein